MIRSPVDATAFAVFDMRAPGAESFGVGLAEAGDDPVAAFFRGLDVNSDTAAGNVVGRADNGASNRAAGNGKSSVD